MKKHRIAQDVKEQIINRIKNEGVSVVDAAKDHGISENTIYGWIAKKTEGQPTLSEIIKLKRENTQLLQLVGEMTLKLSDTQKRSEGRQYDQGAPRPGARHLAPLPLVQAQEARQRLGTQMSY